MAAPFVSGVASLYLEDNPVTLAVYVSAMLAKLGRI
jgi:hypothetical protein